VSVRLSIPPIFLLITIATMISNYLTRQKRPYQPHCAPSSSKGKEPVRDATPVPSRSSTVPSQPSSGLSNSSTSLSVLKTPPRIISKSDSYTGAKFSPRWHLLKHKQGQISQPIAGKIGFRIAHKRTFGQNTKHAPFWKYGADLEWIQNSISKQAWLCHLCHEDGRYGEGFYVVNGSAAIYRHLRTKHRIGWDNNGLEVKLSSSQANLVSGRAQVTTRTTVSQQHFDSQGYLKAIIDWSIKQDLTYRQVTSEDTRDILSFDRPEMDATLWENHSTLRNHIEEAYNLRLVDIRELLQAANSKIHISCDIWTSTNSHSLLGVVAHFLGKKLLL